MDDRLLKLDFASLRALQAVHDQGSFTRAAEVLGQTQSNVSYTISRLRKVLGDPLFVREGGMTRPTTRCTTIVKAVAGLLEGFESAISDQEFDPRHVDATVTISCNHYERVTVLPRLIRLLRKDAPGLRLRSIAANTFGGEQLKRGDCDLLIGPLPIPGEGVFTRTLSTDRYVLVMDASHPLARKSLVSKDLDGLRHVAISFAGRWEPLYTTAFQQNGIVLNAVVEVAEHGDVGGYVLETDLAAIVPERIATGLDSALIVRGLPFDVPFSIDMFWTTRTHHARLHHWVRETITQLEKSTVLCTATSDAAPPPQ